METLIIVKGFLILFFLLIARDMLKQKIGFGIKYQIDRIEPEGVILIDTQNKKQLSVSKSVLDPDVFFTPGDIVQLHIIYICGEKTVHRLKKV